MRKPTVKLTAFIEQKEHKARINKHLTIPIKKTGATLQIDTPKGIYINYGDVGMAYDYWFRCVLIKKNRIKVDITEDFIGVKYGLSRFGHIPEAQEQLVNCIENTNQYINAELDTSSLLEACLLFAKFESGARSGYPIDNFSISLDALNQLQQICDNTDFQYFQGKEIILNPTFGLSGTKLAFRSDGDLIIDGCLIELKTSKTIRPAESIRQLTSYYILNKLKHENPAITEIAMYYPRYGYYKSLGIREVLKKSGEQHLLEYFKKQMGIE